MGIFDILKNRGSGVYTLQQTMSSLEENDSTYTCPMRTKNAVSCLDSNFSSITSGEVFGPDSKCFDTTVSSICLQANCNIHTHKVDIIYNGSTHTCNYAGETLHLPPITAIDDVITIQCPKLETICSNIICPSDCSGKGMCD